MTGLLLEHFKLVVLFAWIAAVITLAHFGQAAPAPRKPRRRAAAAR